MTNQTRTRQNTVADVHVPVVINQEDLGRFGQRLKEITDALGRVDNANVKAMADMAYMEAHAALKVERFRRALPGLLGHIRRLEAASAAWRASRQASGLSGPTEKQARAAEADAMKLRMDMYAKAHPGS